jgi:hypothetical protein
MAILLCLLGMADLGLLSAWADTPDSPKTHTLFMGADFSVGKDSKTYAVKDVLGSSWVVDVGGQEREISTKDGALNIKITPSLKLTQVFATIANLKDERGYSMGNDPIARQTRALVTAANVNAGYQAAASQADARMDASNQQNGSVVFKGSGTQGSTFGGPPSVPIQYRQFTPGSTREQLAAASTGVSAGADNEMAADRLPSGFDAMDVQFEVSSEKYLAKPYVVTVTRFRPRGASPGMVQNLVYSKALDPIDSHPKSIRLLEEGFPQDFELLDFQVHLYNRGTEVATSVSPKRVSLSWDEAFEYIKIEYEGAHKTDSLAPTPALGRLPSDLAARLAEGKYRNTLYVRVSPDGLPAGVYSDAACSRSVNDSYLLAAVGSMRFKPALKDGKPLEGVAPIRLGELSL